MNAPSMEKICNRRLADGRVAASGPICAADGGLTQSQGEVLRSNTNMLRFARAPGLAGAENASDEQNVRIVTRL